MGATAQEAAGTIHTDFARGFIRAETLSYADFLEFKSDAAAKAAGRLRLEGKEYVCNDGDVMMFRCAGAPPLSLRCMQLISCARARRFNVSKQ